MELQFAAKTKQNRNHETTKPNQTKMMITKIAVSVAALIGVSVAQTTIELEFLGIKSIVCELPEIVSEYPDATVDTSGNAFVLKGDFPHALNEISEAFSNNCSGVFNSKGGYQTPSSLNVAAKYKTCKFYPGAEIHGMTGFFQMNDFRIGYNGEIGNDEVWYLGWNNKNNTQVKCGIENGSVVCDVNENATKVGTVMILNLTETKNFRVHTFH
mmetsp:Transcript_20002/g.43123  ORF Transcript_20002/g.43123 Transcript_20002/m.43123 type:complete len:213 (-) Transcript_20002:1068-1706(-)